MALFVEEEISGEERQDTKAEESHAPRDMVF